MKAIRSTLLFLAAVSLLLATAGCFESATLLSVKKDGSGMVVVREYFSPQITEMMAGMPGEGGEGTVAGAEGKAAPDPKAGEKKPAAPIDLFKEQIEKRVAKMGEGVTLAESKPISNDAGWKGYQAKYAFKDVRKLRLELGDTDMGGSGAGSGGAEEKKSGSAYTFEFAPGSPATLKIVPAVKEKPAVAEPPAEAKQPDTDIAAFGEIEKVGEGQAASQMAAGMSGMLGGMFQGMRMTFLVQVEGAITRTDSSYRSETSPNVITVMDMPVDKMMSNQAAMSLLMSQDENAAEKLSKMNIEGLKMADAERPVTVSFE